MCVPGCMETVQKRLSRRQLLGGAAGVAALAAAAPRPVRAQDATIAAGKVVDLTHALPPDFPTYFGEPGLAINQKFAFADSGFNLNEWVLNEHTGTHIDSPLHFSADGHACDEIPAENLVAPLIVIDIAAKAEDNADAQLTPDDIRDWMSANGEIPDGACVAMHSGWDKHVTSDKFRNADGDGKMHFPGFHVEAATMLIEEANVVGMAVDTLSLDFGVSEDFATHYKWLPTNRWGLENVANLGAVPAIGSTIVVGAPKIVGATGGPSRILALMQPPEELQC